MARYFDYYYTSADGLKLYARDYTPVDPRGVILCMHGLTRNSADFEGIVEHLAPHYRLIVVDQRGRGCSEYDAATDNYQPAVYVQDMFQLLDELQLEKVILMGTSMGGLMSMMMVAMAPHRFSAVILNDIGPVVNPAGLERIKAYVGKTGAVDSWDAAVARMREIQGCEFPDFTAQQWDRFTRALYREDAHGVPVLAYDPAISIPLLEAEVTAVPPDLWPLFDAMVDTPLLVIRGQLSDILASSCVLQMQLHNPTMQLAEIPNRGHAPILDEPESIAAIDRFLGTILGTVQGARYTSVSG